MKTITFSPHAIVDALAHAKNIALNRARAGAELFLVALVWCATALFAREKPKPEPFDPAWSLFLDACEQGLPLGLEGAFDEGLRRGYHRHAWREDRHGFHTSALHFAISGGSLAAVSRLVRAGASIEARDDYNRSALARAAAFGNEAACALLIELGARLHPHAGADPLCCAAQAGQPQAIRQLLASGSRPRKARSGDGFGALGYACRGSPMIGPGHIECIELLLAAGADPREARGDGTTALMWASEDGNLRAIELLLAAGARPHQRRDDGSDALMLALRNLKRDPAAALALAALAQPLRTPRRDGRDDLMCAARGGMPECVAWALSRGGDASARDKDGNTALHFAAVSGSRKAVEMLVAAGARIDALNQKGFSPMRGGANGLDPDAFEALALAGADPLLHDGTPNASPFFQACARGWFDQIDICLDRGLKRRLESGEGERICELAEQAHPCGSRVRDYVNYLTSRDEKAALLAETPNQPDPKPRAILRV